MTDGATRRLAAIVSADVVGYSRLMGIDEAGTLDALRQHRAELIDPLITKHHGRIVKTMGDGLLMEFPSVVEATRCVIAIQQGMRDRNSGVDEDKRVAFRVGVNLGDIIIDGTDILGDGVNIAARLQEIAEPGGVAVSSRVHDDIRDRLDVSFTDGGEQSLKNISRPLHIWRWSPFGDAAAERPEPVTNAVEREKPSIAVLPFDNMSSDPEHEFFADGIAEDIITALSKISQMRVIARNSTFTYKGQAHDLRQVAAELGVRYVLEGSVRSGGKRLRITAQLIDATDGSHLWADRFDRTIDDIFDIQDEITKEIVTALRVNLTDGEEAAVLARGTSDIEAWQLCSRATELFLRFNPTDYLEARSLAERAIARDENYAYAWATLGFTFWWDGRLGYTGDSEVKFQRAYECAEQAMSIDNSVSWAIGLATMVAGAQDRHAEGVALGRRCYEHSPGSADSRAFLAFALSYAGEYPEAVDHFHAAMSLNPFYPNWYRNGLARTLMMQGKFNDALSIMDEILGIEPTFFQAWLQKAAILHELERFEESKHAVREVMRIAPNLRLSSISGLYMINDKAGLESFKDALRQAGLPD